MWDPDSLAFELMAKRYDEPNSFVGDCHISSYNQMLNKNIHQMMHKQFDEFRQIKGNDLHVIIIRKLTIEQPKTKEGTVLTEEFARLRGFNFLSDVSAHLEYRTFSLTSPKTESYNLVNKNYYNASQISRLSSEDMIKYPFLIREHVYPKFPYFQIPILIQTLACPNSDGLEFNQCLHSMGSCAILSGIERYLMKRDRLKYNRAFKSSVKGIFEVQIRSEHVNKFRSTSTCYILATKRKRYQPKSMYVRIPYVKKAIPLHVIFMALGWTDDPVNGELLADKILGSVYYKLEAIAGKDNKDLLNTMVEDLRKSLLPPPPPFISGKRKRSKSNSISTTGYEIFYKNQGWDIKDQNGALKYIARAALPTQDIEDIDWSNGTSNANSSNKKFVTDDKVNEERMIYTAKKTIASEVLPHVAHAYHHKTEDDLNYHKGMIIAEAVADVLLFQVKLIGEDKRDKMINKSIDTQGELVCNLLRQLLRTHYKRVRHAIAACLEHDNIIRIKSVFTDKTITPGLLYSFKTGVWSTRKTAKSKKQSTGVSQIRNVTNINSTLKQLTQLMTPNNQNGRLMDVRRIQDQDGIIDYVFTPEGADGCGTTKQDALTSFISLGSDDQFIIHWFFQNGVADTRKLDLIKLSVQAKNMFYTEDSKIGYRINVNGKWIGTYPCVGIEALKKKLIELRRNMYIDWFTSIALNKKTKELYVATTAGRSLRPLLIVKNLYKITPKQFSSMSWHDCIKAQIIEFLDKVEEDTIDFAKNEIDYWNKIKEGKNIEHIVIHPSLMLGISSSQIPGSEHNQSPRNAYQCNMGNQTMSIPFTNFMRRTDTIFYVLFYTMRPWVETMTLKFLNCQDLAMGQDSSFGILSYTGYNQEDSSIRNQRSIELGFGRVMRFTTSISEERTQGSSQNLEEFNKPSPFTCEALKYGDYSTIDDDGLPFPGTFLHDTSIIFGKTMPISTMNIEEKSSDIVNHCTSTLTSQKDSGLVDIVMITNNVHNRRSAKVRTRKSQAPVIGDKFSSRHAQKGTCGDNMKPMDMPYDEDGNIVMGLINPHAFPSRMTIAHMIEKLSSLLASATVKRVDATAFTKSMVKSMEIRDKFKTTEFFNNTKDPIDFEETLAIETPESKVELMVKALHLLGLDSSSRMYNGTNGILLGGDSKYGEGRVFRGSVFEQRLCHNAEDKQHARAKGSKQVLTQQATEGKPKGGGLRCGEMEMWCMFGHGSSALLRDRLFLSADKHRNHVCARCGLQAISIISEGLYICRRCGNNQSVHQVFVPHAFKLFTHELFAMGVVPRMQLSTPFLSKMITDL